ncbi:hypothetical protein PAL_GLEAN10005190 [Pteropus alecto]|uniref:Uncharacterized protein n=1 Tax=Pteropus alecto TaxID=9402 RepID=L5K8J5_PTEAL|nr:hypothetical protein PAL_GLEAN10005190 [Pteropus alecto]
MTGGDRARAVGTLEVQETLYTGEAVGGGGMNLATAVCLAHSESPQSTERASAPETYPRPGLSHQRVRGPSEQSQLSLTPPSPKPICHLSLSPSQSYRSQHSRCCSTEESGHPWTQNSAGKGEDTGWEGATPAVMPPLAPDHPRRKKPLALQSQPSQTVPAGSSHDPGIPNGCPSLSPSP